MLDFKIVIYSLGSNSSSIYLVDTMLKIKSDDFLKIKIHNCTAVSTDSCKFSKLITLLTV